MTSKYLVYHGKASTGGEFPIGTSSYIACHSMGLFYMFYMTRKAGEV